MALAVAKAFKSLAWHGISNQANFVFGSQASTFSAGVMPCTLSLAIHRTPQPAKSERDCDAERLERAKAGKA